MDYETIYREYFFFLYYGPGVDSVPNDNEYQEHSWE
jgi:hypothetical protein